MAEWLNATFYGFDNAIFNTLHGLAESAGGFLTPIFKVVSIIGEKGIIFFVLAAILMLFAKTRKQGVCMMGALIIGAIITSLILKNVVARVRPYENAEYAAFWEYVGGKTSDSYCFPSGHVTMITAAMTALFMCFNKKWSWVGFLGVILMGVARVYLIAHYATDVIGGVIVGVLAAVIAFFITKLIFYILEKNKETKFCKFCLEFDAGKLCGKKAQNEETEDEKDAD